VKKITEQLKNILNKYKIYGTSKKILFKEVLSKVEKRVFKTEFEGDYLKKIDLSNTLKNVASFIAIGFPYPTFYPKLLNRTISSYTIITDYHKVLIKELKKTVEDLKKIFPGNYVILVDSSKVFEKELAVESGLGFFGKNTLVINKEYGSFFFIGIIVTDVNLPLISSHNHKGLSCSECRRCEMTCPNNAIKEYKLLADKCISYITSTKESGRNTSKYIWGCDLCQIVCPFNINRKTHYFEEFKYEFNIKLTEVKNKKEYNLYSKNLPLRWRGFNVFKKNL